MDPISLILASLAGAKLVDGLLTRKCRYCGQELKSGESEDDCPKRPGRNSGQGYYSGGCNPSGGGGSCFPAGTMVLMGDYTEKPIEEVLIGEVVITPFGPARVKVLERPLLGNRPLYEMQNGRKLRTSSEQSIWGRNPETLHEWWATRDIDQWRYEAESGIGSSYSPEPVDLTDQDGVEWEFATVEGWNKTVWKRVDAPEDLQLYDIFLDSAGAYFADGYMVKTFPDTPTEDRNRYRHRPIGARFCADNGNDEHATANADKMVDAILA